MGKKRKRNRQRSMWVATADLPQSAGHPFYARLNRVLDDAGFDTFVETQCAKFYAEGLGRPSVTPGRYFRLLLLGYFEGLDSERAIAWRAADSLSIRDFLDVDLHEAPPDLAYYSGWRKQEILGLTWEEIDMAGGVIRLSPGRSKTLVGRILPISPPIANALNRRRARRDPDSPLVFHRDDIPVRRWRTAWRTACQAAGVPTRFLHDCRRTAARNLIRANVPERVAMLLTGHKSRAIFDRYNIINEQELLDAGDQLVAYLAQQAQAEPARRRPHTVSPGAPLRLSHSPTPVSSCRNSTKFQPSRSSPCS